MCHLSYFVKAAAAVGFSTNRVLHIWDLSRRELLPSVP
jgi:hypothetical protein